MAGSTLVAVRTVLVADDTAFVRDRFKSALEGAGHKALVAGTGPEVLAILKQAERVDLIVLDLRIPQGHGLDLLQTIRRMTHVPPRSTTTGARAPASCSASRSPTASATRLRRR
jgi:two-component system NtrC family response regulator